MNRKELKDINLSDDQIRRVMALYGQSIKQHSNKIKELEADKKCYLTK